MPYALLIDAPSNVFKSVTVPALNRAAWLSLRLGRALSRIPLRIIAAYFLASGSAARQASREFLQRAHAIENHSRRHLRTFALLGMSGLRAEIAHAQSILAELAGRPPRFFRPPAGLRNPLLDPVLHAMNLCLASWTRRGFDTLRGDASEVAARLLDGLAAGDILLLHDGHAARTASDTPVVLDVLPRVLDRIESLGLRPVTLREAVDS